ncbi:MAG: LemA family protein [Promethearchaeota archaeon]
MASSTSTALICVGLTALIIGGGFAGFYFLTYNSLVTTRWDVDLKLQNIYTQYQRKYDLIPQLIEIVESYTSLMTEWITNLTALRTEWLTAIAQGGVDGPANASGELDQYLTLFIATAESYPSVEFDELWVDLMAEITGTENRITNAKLDYNAAINRFNIMVSTFPGIWLAPSLGYTPGMFTTWDLPTS